VGDGKIKKWKEMRTAIQRLVNTREKKVEAGRYKRYIEGRI
jgi:hypothetical protein